MQPVEVLMAAVRHFFKYVTVSFIILRKPYWHHKECNKAANFAACCYYSLFDGIYIGVEFICAPVYPNINDINDRQTKIYVSNHIVQKLISIQIKTHDRTQFNGSLENCNVSQ